MSSYTEPPPLTGPPPPTGPQSPTGPQLPTGPQPPTGSPPLIVPPLPLKPTMGFPFRVEHLLSPEGFPVRKKHLLSLPEALEHDDERPLPDQYITCLYMDFYKFSCKDIHKLLIKKELIGADEVLTSERLNFYHRLTIDAIDRLLRRYKSDYTAEGLGKLLAQGQTKMDDLFYCMYLGDSDKEGNHVEGLDAKVDNSHPAYALRKNDQGIYVFGNDVYKAAWYTVNSQSSSMQS